MTFVCMHIVRGLYAIMLLINDDVSL